MSSDWVPIEWNGNNVSGWLHVPSGLGIMQDANKLWYHTRASSPRETYSLIMRRNLSVEQQRLVDFAIACWLRERTSTAKERGTDSHGNEPKKAG